MDVQDKNLSPIEIEIKEKVETDYGAWPEIAGAILTVFVVFVLFTFSDGSY